MNKEKVKEKVYLNWRVKEQRIKGFKFNKNFRNNSQNYSKNTYKGTRFESNTQPNFTAAKNKDIPNNHVKNNEQREPVKCWEC